MKKNIVLLAVLLAAMLFTACSSEPQEVVNVYNWGEYIDESIFDDLKNRQASRLTTMSTNPTNSFIPSLTAAE